METRHNEVLISKNEAVEMINRYAVLVNDGGMHEVVRSCWMTLRTGEDTLI